MLYNSDNVFPPPPFPPSISFSSKCPSMFEQLCRKITDFPVLMTDFLPTQNPRHALLGLESVFTSLFF